MLNSSRETAWHVLMNPIILGNCLFRALSHQLYGSQDRHRQVRSMVVEHMRRQADHFKHFLPVGAGGATRRNPTRRSARSSRGGDVDPTENDVDLAFARHLNQMAQNGAFGGHLELAAFAAMHNIAVRVFRSDGDAIVAGDEASPQVVRIAYHVSYYISCLLPLFSLYLLHPLLMLHHLDLLMTDIS